MIHRERDVEGILVGEGTERHGSAGVRLNVEMAQILGIALKIRLGFQDHVILV